MGNGFLKVLSIIFDFLGGTALWRLVTHLYAIFGVNWIELNSIVLIALTLHLLAIWTIS